PSDGSTRAGTTAGDLAPTLRGAAVLLAAPLRAAPGGGAVRERVGLEAVVDLARHARAGVALDRAEVVLLVRRDERDRVAGCLGAARPPDPVDVVLRDVRRVVVDHVRDRVHVDPARGDVGGDEHLELPVLEAGEGALALALRAVRVDRGGREALPVERPADLVGAVLRAR